jgi:hypothetical protein
MSKKKKENLTIEKLLDSATKLSREQCILILSGIAQGEIKDFTGLAPSLETRIKAIDKLLPLIDTEIDDSIKELTITITDATDDKRIEALEEKIKKGGV